MVTWRKVWSFLKLSTCDLVTQDRCWDLVEFPFLPHAACVSNYLALTLIVEHINWNCFHVSRQEVLLTGSWSLTIKHHHRQEKPKLRKDGRSEGVLTMWHYVFTQLQILLSALQIKCLSALRNLTQLSFSGLTLLFRESSVLLSPRNVYYH